MGCHQSLPRDRLISPMHNTISLYKPMTHIIDEVSPATKLAIMNLVGVLEYIRGAYPSFLPATSILQFSSKFPLGSTDIIPLFFL